MGKNSLMVALRMPGSVFDGAEIHLTTFDTAKMVFQLQLVGSAEAAARFAAHLASLEKAFKERHRNLTIEIKRPKSKGSLKYRVKKKKGGKKGKVRGKEGA